jgi:bifunctional non-homologous end joining protein LigD
MTKLGPEFAALPPDAQLDGELSAWGDDGNPDFHRLGRRMLHGDRSIPVTFMEFDVLALDGEPTLRLPYTERHAPLEEIVLDAPPALVDVIGSFEDGPALWDVIVSRGMEGVVAKRARQSYRPGSRPWVKTKNRATARFQEELAGATRRRVAPHE